MVSSQEESDIEVTGEDAELQYIDEADFLEVRDAFMATGLVDAVAPAIAETVGVQDVTTQQTEPRVYLTAIDAGVRRGVHRRPGRGWREGDAAGDLAPG